MGGFEMVRKLNRQLRPYGFAYNPRQDVFFAIKNVRQGQAGHGGIHAVLAPRHNVVIDSETVSFEYGGRDWLVVLRKGQYGLAGGAEVGFYVVEDNSSAVPEEHLPHISFSVWQNGDLLFSRAVRHYWLMGFMLGTYVEPEELTMHVEITFHDVDFLRAFVDALKKLGYDEDNLLERERTVWIIFHRPSSQAARRRRPLFDSVIRKKSNYLTCYLFNKLVPTEKNAATRLLYLRNRFPWIYNILFSNFKRKLSI